MTVIRENLVLDLYYASETTSGGKTAKLTAILRDSTNGTEVLTTTLIRTGTEEDGVYTVGFQSISNASEPMLLKLETYFRGVDKEMFEKMMVKADELYTSYLNPNNTWLGQYGLRIVSNEPVENYIPESVFA
ncbi:hypothetical protein I9Y19_004054 [Citrobacter freundii]|uniref:Phage protein n=1 Tax=Citrobacter freundii TaxID=546 RepID=A0ABY7LAV7_CITFR|nr:MULTISPECIES: hypothetical protein [Enterobacteriaceae]EBO0495814.1 hypothetical protein [Salmonella enterica]EBW6339160.1 hypothetical protein [Salmonella enterica subsp. enterica serovar Oslo]EED5478031.1 hypothetical protein [Salmonella enterica subsp. enterica serovar Tennessee]HCB4671699.1 hypothetical protein [Enterobacter cloacae]EBU3468647.1 hypothetical protein [Salmonella enterica]